MEKKLKNCYRCLDLPYSATIDEVKTREKAMCKILSSQAEYESKCEKEIAEVQTSATYIIENLKNNGTPTEEYHCFEASKESVIGIFIVFVTVALLCFFSFYILL